MEFIKLLCDVCKKNEMVGSVEVNRQWYGVCKECKDRVQKEKDKQYELFNKKEGVCP